MERLKYSDILRRLEGFDQWLVRLGLTPRPNDRIHEAIRFLRNAEELSKKGKETGHYADIHPKDWFPVVDALEAHDVFAAFQDDPSPTVALSLQRALSGPSQPILENSRNGDGRNVWFELALAAEWKLRGANVRLDEPDLCLIKDQVTFLIACKRPASGNSIQNNIEDAIKQLRRNLSSAKDKSFGVAAISISRIFNAGDQVFNGDMEGLRNHFNNWIDSNMPYFATISDPRICCILFHLATPALGDEQVDLARASFAAAVELIPSLGSKIFEQHVHEMRDTPKQLWEHSTGSSG
jgi:hypothetical protein